MEQQSQYLTPFQRKRLLKSLETHLRPEYRRRIEIMLMADTGYSQAQICETLNCSQETARYWIAVAQSGLAHNWHDRPMGRPKTVSPEYIERLRELVNHSPRDYGYPFQRWTAQWLSKHLAKELGIKVSDRYINYLLKKMGLSTRPKPASNPSQANETLPQRLLIHDLHPTDTSSSPDIFPLYPLIAENG